MTYPAHPADSCEMRLSQLLHPANPLCRSDVIWTLEWLKKKATGLDASMLDSSQPPLLSTFRCFAEASLLILRGKPSCQQELARLRQLLTEAVHGMQLLSQPRNLAAELQSTPSS